MGAITNNTGNPVTGKDHFNRVVEKRLLIERMEEGKHTNIASARRTGKTSIMRETLSTLREQGWVDLELDFSACRTVVDFFDKLTGALEHQLQAQKNLFAHSYDALQGILKGVSKRSIKVSVAGTGFEMGAQGDQAKEEKSPTEIAEALALVLSAIAEKSKAKRMVLGIDELTVFFHHYLSDAPNETNYVQRIKDIDVLLYCLRVLRQQTAGQCMWLHCSSIGLDGFVKQHQLTHAISGLTSIELEAFSAQDTRAMLQALWEGKKQKDLFPLDVADRMIERLTWLMPFFTQLLFHTLWERRQRSQQQTPLTPQQVDEAYDELISVRNSVLFQHWHDRLDQLIPKNDLPVVKTLLDKACTQKLGVKRDAMFTAVMAQQPGKDLNLLETQVRHLLDRLEHDGYLLRQGKPGANTSDVYLFRSPLLRDYWAQHCKKIISRPTRKTAKRVRS